MSHPDSHLMLLFQRDGDRAALASLVERNGSALLRFLIRLSRNRTIAEDVAQQTWLKVIDVARQGTFAAASGVAFRTWLCTLARNHFIDEYQRKFAAARSVLTAAPRDTVLSRKKYALAKLRVLMRANIRATAG